MKNKLNNFYVLIFLSYLILIFGFITSENITTGGKDWPHVSRMILNFTENFQSYFPVYENRHSPVLYIILSLFKKIGLNFDTIRFLHLHINLITLIFAYKCLKIKYPNLKDILILLLSLSIVLLSPNLRTAGYWSLPYSLGFLFLVNFFYFTLKYSHKLRNGNDEIKYLILSIFFLALSSYISPNFCLFGIYFIYIFLKKENKKKITFPILFFSIIILALPGLYYFFIYNPFFIFKIGVSSQIDNNVRFNIFNKIAIVSTIIFFHLSPFLLKIPLNNIFKNAELKLKFIILLIIYFVTLYNFNFMPEFGGGGFFYKLSYILLDNDYLFLVFFFISLIFIFLIIDKSLNNFIFIFIFILMNPQLSIYHRYYDPLVLLTFLLFFEKNIFKKEIIDKNMTYIIFFYILFFNISYSVRNYF